MNPIISIITLTLNTPIKNTGIDRSIKNARPECMMPYDPAIPLLGTFPRETDKGENRERITFKELKQQFFLARDQN